MTGQYDVGYGKPTSKHQFKKGKSGNPSGRPKRPTLVPALDPQKIFIAELKSPITIKKDGKKIKLTAMEAIWKLLVADTLKGDKTARKYVMDFMLKQDKYAFEDGELLYRMTKDQLEALDALTELTKDDPFESEQQNGSSSST
jgi:hypothetical protein